jgi:type I restriction enzyme S subunit
VRDGWRQARLGEILSLEYGKPLERHERKPDGRYPVYGANGEKERAEKWFFDKPSIVIGRKGSAGEINLTEGKFWPLDVTYFIKFDDTKYDLRFLYYLLALQDLPSLAKGVKPGINRNEVYGLRVFVASLKEQQRIVTILDEAFAAIATAKAKIEKNLQNTLELFQSKVQCDIDEAKASNKRLGSVVTRLTNGYVGPTRNIYVDSGVPYLLARHVRDNRLSFDGRTFVSHEFNQKNRKSMLAVDDVLLVQSGHIGHSAVVSNEHEGHNCHAMIVISPAQNELTGSFLSLLFSSPSMQRKFQAIRSGSTVPHLTCGEVKELLIPVPGLMAQAIIVERARKYEIAKEKLKLGYQRKLAALDELKQSVLSRAFTGEL